MVDWQLNKTFRGTSQPLSKPAQLCLTGSQWCRKNHLDDKKREKCSHQDDEDQQYWQRHCAVSKGCASDIQKTNDFTKKGSVQEIRKAGYSNKTSFVGRATGRSRLSSTFVRHRTPHSVKLLIIVLIMGSLPGIDPSELSKTICTYLKYKKDCSDVLETAQKGLDATKIYCPGEFDDHICWPNAVAGSLVEVPCPGFHHEINDSFVAYRVCRDNGSWHTAWDHAEEQFVKWSHKEQCQAQNLANETFEGNTSDGILRNFQTMYSVGYGISLVCLVVALLLLGFFKKLHCTRNYIHMNLMVSFILRYSVTLVKDSVLNSYYKLDLIEDDTSVTGFDFSQLQEYCDEYGSPGWVLTRCRLIITMMHYSITANFFWLLAEGLYLQMLLVFVMSENKYFAAFMAFGWGGPWISVIIWVVLRLRFDNGGCWEVNDKLHIWWTIRAPIIITIVINFFIFVNIVRLIVSKLHANNMAHSDTKLRLAKSTLALIPLLGIHYIVFFALTEEVAEDNATPMHLKMGFDIFLTSIQGALVAILYCFLNGEVQAEVKKVWRNWTISKHLPKGAHNLRKSSTINSTNHSTQMTYFSRHSTAGGDAITQDTIVQQSPNTERQDLDSQSNLLTKRSSFNSLDKKGKHEMSNGNGITMNDKKNQICYNHECSKNTNSNDYSNNRLDVQIEISSIGNGSEINGDIECQANTPFLQEDSV